MHKLEELSVNDLFFLAVKVEEESIRFYEKLKSIFGNKLSNDIDFLINEENKHLKFFKDYLSILSEDKMNECAKANVKEFIAYKSVLENAGVLDEENHEAIYNIALAVEEFAIQIFVKLLNDVERDEIRSAINIILKEEIQHKKKIKLILAY